MSAGVRRLRREAAAPAVALLFAVLASSLVLLIAGSNPLRAYGDMLAHASKLETMVDILNRATPLFISGIAAAIGFRMNLFNIGVEGQYLLAALVAAAVGGAVHLPAPLHIALILVVAMTVGGAYSGVAGVLKVTRGINEVISTIMLNAIAISGLIVAGLKAWQAGGAVGGNVTRVGTAEIDKSGRIPNLNGIVEVFTRKSVATVNSPVYLSWRSSSGSATTSSSTARASASTCGRAEPTRPPPRPVECRRSGWSSPQWCCRGRWPASSA